MVWRHHKGAVGFWCEVQRLGNTFSSVASWWSLRIMKSGRGQMRLSLAKSSCSSNKFEIRHKAMCTQDMVEREASSPAPKHQLSSFTFNISS